MIKVRPPRLERIFDSLQAPLFFVTICTLHRRPVLATAEMHAAWRQFAERAAKERGILVGRYVIMPDHVHFFVSGPAEFRLGDWVRMLKNVVARGQWQPGFFDHLLRQAESYEEKWQYVAANPARAGLVGAGENWPYQGEIAELRM